ncbi:hypothetical protein WICPIJ_001536 [Wickerhamomyces pijperi]|uniref:Glycosyltransferase family 15 protein n=1 Tax=Wickerhamomyces pijperi TaxID=599730 RepID=A0A9P8QBG0_WICPI|nr:hypothetical protein WICPIJ_001536 [Wickerhamomyces pijperi]
MAKVSDRVVRLAVFTLLIIGLITFFSSSSPSAPSGTYTKPSSSSGSSSKDKAADFISKGDSVKASGSDSDSSNSLFSSFSSSSKSTDKLPFDVPDYIDPNYARENATFISLARNEDLWELVPAIRSVEDRFNSKYKYDWVFLNEEPFSVEFKTVMTSLVSGEAKFGLIPKEHWSFPDWIDTDKAAQTREDMKNIIYGSSISYRHMCRFESGFFFHHELMQNYKYYWRVEPSTKLYCDVNFDVFKFMRENNKDYGFTISIHEFEATIKTLWSETKKFVAANPQYVAEDNFMNFISDNNGETYNLCHFWTNFEVANMDFWRGEAYQAYFQHLEKAGGFFYERWGDAPVHSIAASLFLPQDRIHFFEEIGYFHGPYHHCPINDEIRNKNKCMCKPGDDFTWQDYSCTRKYYDVKGLAKPLGWEKHTG